MVTPARDPAQRVLGDAPVRVREGRAGLPVLEKAPVRERVALRHVVPVQHHADLRRIENSANGAFKRIYVPI